MKYLTEGRSEVKIGLEIHFQVKGNKLFCSCPTEESDIYGGTFERKLTVVSGESSEKDIAALQESLKGKDFEYLITDNSCLVEMDEEPPHIPKNDTIETGIIVSLILGCKIVDNLHFMRKIVVDGSNTSGFQRTGIIGLDGSFLVRSKKIGISAVTLEEEACKKVKESEKAATYSLDRLGIPLIEVSTEPDMSSPKDAREVAEAIGLSVRQSGMIRREASSIRQDLNISIRGGNRVEIKGVQSLSQIEKVLKQEIERQESLVEIVEILKGRAVSTEFFLEDLTDLGFFKGSELFTNGIKSGKKIYGFSLPGLSGVLNNGKFRLGREIAERLKAVGIGGFIHSDELPNNGIGESVKREISAKLGSKSEDAFGLIILEPTKIEECIEIVQSRVREAQTGVPAETRGATENGTKFLRPLPGNSRMYPETDIPLIPLDSTYVIEVEKNVPHTVQERMDHLESLGIPRQEAFNSLWKEYDDILESLVSQFGNPKVCAKFLSVVYSSKSPDLDKAKNLIERFSNGNIPYESLEALYLEGEFSLSKNKKIELRRDGSLKFSLNLNDKIELTDINADFKIKDRNTDNLLKIIDGIVKENEPLIRDRGESSFKLLMGKVMKEVRGQFEGKEISDLLTQKIKEVLNKTEH